MAKKAELASLIRDAVGFAADAYMKACRDMEKRLDAAAKKKADIAMYALDLILVAIPPSFKTTFTHTLLGLNSNLEKQALAEALAKAQNSVRGGFVRMGQKVWDKEMRTQLKQAVGGGSKGYVSELEGLAPRAFGVYAEGITSSLAEQDLLTLAGYWLGPDPKTTSFWTPTLEREVMMAEMLIDSINWPGIDLTPGGPPGYVVYIVDESGNSTQGHDGANMAVINFLHGDNSELMFYIPPRFNEVAIEQHVSEYGVAPFARYVCDGNKATRYKGK